jgi:predicted nucleotide-binding protein
MEVRDFDLPAIELGIKKLNRRIEQVRSLDPQSIGFDDQQVEAAERDIGTTVLEIFGQRSPEYREHQYHRIWHGDFNLVDDDYARQVKFADGIPQTIKMLEGLIARLEEKKEDLNLEKLLPKSQVAQSSASRRVFLVHGRDEELKLVVARFLEKLKLNPIILHEQPNQGQTLIEKFEANSDVGFAVVLLTPDDMGFSSGDPSHPVPRARQNVVFELGYFFGRIGRGKVCGLFKGGVEIPSDVHGVAYVSFEDPKGWQLLLAREIKAAEIDVDLNLAI